MNSIEFHRKITSRAHVVFPITSFSLVAPHVAELDLSGRNREFDGINLGNTAVLEKIINDAIRRAGASYGIGGHGENRVWYQRSSLFGDGDTARTIHLGVDLWAPPGTVIFCPLPGRIHSFQDNAKFGDYGPTVIIQHEIDGDAFFTLFGHLDRASLKAKQRRNRIEAGELVGRIGKSDENGNWPPHVHFQIILDLLGMEGDFPGVATRVEKQRFLSLCPEPKLLLAPKAN